MNAYAHSLLSVKRRGGAIEDYYAIHDFMDSTKSAVADNRHRVITHNAWFIGPDGPLERVFGKTITNSDGRAISVRTIGEQHCLEDFHGFIPTLQDWTMAMGSEPWMSGMAKPPSSTGLRMNKQPELVVEELVD